MNDKKGLLGEVEFVPFSFPDIEKIFANFRSKVFFKTMEIKRLEVINKTLLQKIEESPENVFLLATVTDYIRNVNEDRLLSINYSLSMFEIWLNDNTGILSEKNLLLRGKIMGKFVPRHDYQHTFPIGMNQIHDGSHFVTAHRSPDVDSIIASFWGWVDAFAGQIGNKRHIWNLTDGAIPGYITNLFTKMLGKKSLDILSHRGSKIKLTALDFITKSGFVMKKGDENTRGIMHDKGNSSVILIDNDGYYLGDWRTGDVENVRWVLFLFTSCLHWIADNISLQMIALFACRELVIEDVKNFIDCALSFSFKDASQARNFSDYDESILDSCLISVLCLEMGITSSFKDLIADSSRFKVGDFAGFFVAINELADDDLFDDKGYLKDDRALLFSRLQNILETLNGMIQQVRMHFERLDVAIQIKQDVLKIPLVYVLPEERLESIEEKMGNFYYLTVAYPSIDDNRLIPLGIVKANDLRKKFVGTISFRDFCNFEEVDCPSSIKLISAMDHHKTSVNTSTQSSLIIGDVQSANVLVAEDFIRAGEVYSQGHAQIGDELYNLLTQLTLGISNEDATSLRKVGSVIKKCIASDVNSKFFISKEREFVEYIFLLIAIFDDTDSLQKVSARDVECVVKIVNKLKAIQMGHECEILNFDDISKNENFPSGVAKKILQNEDVYSIYKGVAEFRCNEIDEFIKDSSSEFPLNFFADTKEQNGCARVGQTKMFVNNFALFRKYKSELYTKWGKKAEYISVENNNISFQLHMISTILDADETFKNAPKKYYHRDEIWMHVSDHENGRNLFAKFLHGFSNMKILETIRMEVEFFGMRRGELKQLFLGNFANFTGKSRFGKFDLECSLIILKFTPGKLNSRKNIITPHIPS